MSKNDDFWNDIAPIEKGDETAGANSSNNADLEKNLLDANKRIDELEKMIETLKSTQEVKEVKEVKEEENTENE